MSMYRPLAVRVATTLTLMLAGLAVVCDTASAQDRLPHRHRVERLQPTGTPPITYRGLTVTRPPIDVPDPYGSDDIYVDGPIRYNDIRDFSPVPEVDSGRQFPFGLDGIGGYGSNLGYNEGQDAAVYDRGALNRAR